VADENKKENLRNFGPKEKKVLGKNKTGKQTNCFHKEVNA
jgi:hypothetical protein